MKEYDTKTRYLYRLAGVLVVVGLVALIAGYVGIRGEADVALQLPYVLSGGIAGIFLLGLGAATAFAAWSVDLTRSQGDVITSVRELREETMALADELRAILANAEVVVESPSEVRASGPR